MNITVTEAKAADYDAWASLYRGYADFYQVAVNDDILQQVWGWIMDPAQAFYCHVACDENGELIGLIHYRAMASPLRGKMVGFLDDLFVAPKARRQGVAQALLYELKQQAQSHDWPFVRWITAEDNHRARALYERLADKTQWLTYQLNASC